jgi:hypothetical protein
MRSMLRYSPLLLILFGCYPEETFDEQPCQSSTDCLRGEGCQISEGRCIEIPNNSLMGTVRCTVTDDPDAPLDIGGSDVTGYLDELEFSQIAANQCLLYPDGSLYITLLGLRFQLFATFRVPSTERQAFPFFDAASDTIAYLGPATGDFSSPAAAFVSGGFYEFDREPAVGRNLEIYLEAFLDIAIDEDRAGVPCERGQVECGARPYATTYCATFVHPVCTADCMTNSDCEVYGVDTCDAEFCYQSCTTTADCIAPLECLTLTSGASICV